MTLKYAKFYKCRFRTVTLGRDKMRDRQTQAGKLVDFTLSKDNTLGVTLGVRHLTKLTSTIHTRSKRLNSNSLNIDTTFYADVTKTKTH